MITRRLDKSVFSCIIAVYKQLIKAARLSARSTSFFLNLLTTVFRNYLTLDVYSIKVIARYKTPTYSMRSV